MLDFGEFILEKRPDEDVLGTVDAPLVDAAMPFPVPGLSRIDDRVPGLCERYAAGSGSKPRPAGYSVASP